MSAGTFVLDHDHLFAGHNAIAAKLKSYDSLVLSSIYDYVRNWDTLTLVIEEKGLDEEYFREFLEFYGCTMWENPSTVERLHFFAKSRDDLEPLLLGDSRPPPDGGPDPFGYLGYVVLRPTSPPTVGEILLRTPQNTHAEAYHTTCSTGFGQTVMGHRLRVRCAPCIGQDQTGVCAHSALWGALKYLHKYRYYPKLSMPEIALKASQRYPRASARPAGGLIPEEMHAVLREAGFYVHLHDAGPSPKGDLAGAQETIRLGVESGLPVLLIFRVIRQRRELGRHAVWVCGHTTSRLPSANSTRQVTPVQLQAVSDPMGRILANDDNYGPYLPVTIELGTFADEQGNQQTLANLRYDGYAHAPPPDESESLRVLEHVMIPLPEEVYLRPVELLPLVREILTGKRLGVLAEQSERQGAPPEVVHRLREFQEKMDSGKIHPRTYLSMSDRFREYCAGNSMCRELKHRYAASFALPEYVWVTELVDLALQDNQQEASARCVVGELILDSTDSIGASTRIGFRYLALHVPGLLDYCPVIEATDGTPADLRAANAGKVTFLSLPFDTPYEQFTLNTDPNDPARSFRSLSPIRGQ